MPPLCFSGLNIVRCIVIFSFLVTWTPGLFAAELEPYFTFTSFSHSEPTAIKAFGEDWDETLYPGSVALTHNRVELGVAWRQWRLGLIKRYDYLYDFSSETAELLYLIENRVSLTPGEQYTLQLSANSLIARGLKLSYQHTVDNVNVGLSVSYLEGQDFIDGALSGDAQAISAKDYDLKFDVDYFYSEDKLFERNAPLPQGRGYGIDFMLDWRPGEQWYFKMDVVDLWAEIHWKDGLRTVATADSNTKQFDDDGYVIFNPVATGIEITESHTQKIPRKIFLNTAYMFQHEHSLLFEYDDYKLKRFVSMGYEYHAKENSKLSVFFNVTADAIKLRYQNQWLITELVADELSINKARTFGLQFAVNYRH